ncbi:MAG: hypothetical protein GF388_05955 [Candidatus Aegiribacteria sp.]|nr:hypothetical protein [Candidatus Aegiribacteria sp.]MBD3294725.1 hypothetical protein [Candidatus Fermentibacteria bacterium]
MRSFKTILVPVDLGPSSKRILAVAGEMAEDIGSKVVVLHVVQPVPSIPLAAGQMSPGVTDGFNVPMYQKTVEEKARESLQEMVRGLVPRENLASINVMTGSVGSSILSECESGSYDLVIVDSGEDDDIAVKLFGTVADKVVKNAPVPVLVLRSGNKENA